MSYPLPGLVVDPQGVSTSVTVTDGTGATATVYSDRYGLSPVSNPQTIVARTTVYVPGSGRWTVTANSVAYAVTLEGAEVGSVTIAQSGSGAYVPLPAGGTVGQVPAITGTGSPPTMAWTTPGSVASYKTTIGDGATKVFTLTHSLNDLDVAVTVWDLTLDQITYPTVGGHTNVNQVTVTFSVAPTLNQMRVIVGAF